VRVLIAEDDATSRMLLERMLTNWGYEVTVTRDGGEAMRALSADDSPRLAILDWMMPVMDGVDLCRSLRELETQQPPYIILLTSLAEKESLVAGLEAGANDYVRKPYDPDELRARVEVGRRFVELHGQLAEARRALEFQARTDALTGVLNRGATLLALEQEMQRATRDGAPLGLGMLDVDRFKRVNDVHGHATGDAVLREVVKRSLSVLRPYDLCGRFGGEEFLFLVPGAGEAELTGVLDRVHDVVGASPIVVGSVELVVTVSLGGAVRGQESADSLIARADEALYVAKKRGRDRVVLALPTSDSA
jgi:two-component system, cell cycle response regulator